MLGADIDLDASAWRQADAEFAASLAARRRAWTIAGGAVFLLGLIATIVVVTRRT